MVDHTRNDIAASRPRFRTSEVSDAHAQCCGAEQTGGRQDTGPDWTLRNRPRPPLAMLSAGRDGKAGDRRRGDRGMVWIWNKQRLCRSTRSTSPHLVSKHEVKSTTFNSSFASSLKHRGDPS